MDEQKLNELFGLDAAEAGGDAGEGVSDGQTGSGGEGGAGETPGSAPEVPGSGGGERGDEASGASGGAAPEAGGPSRPAPGTGQARGAGDIASPRGPGLSDSAYIDGVIRGLNITDPYTHKPITTRAEYDAYQERAYRERRQLIRERTGMSEEELDEFAASMPEVRQARAESERARELIRRQREREARERVDGEIARISALDPQVKTVGDLTRSENYDRLLELVRRGYDLSDAWKIANFDKLRGQAQAASRQAAINSQSGRAGMVQTRQAGQGSEPVKVPQDVMEMYRALNPEMSDADIRKDYGEFIKNKK